MTSRERFLAAIRNEMPDRVPVAPDISTYIPMKMSGLTANDFWTGCKDIPLWQAYLNAADYFGMDAWTAAVFGLPTINDSTPVEWKSTTEVDRARGVSIETTSASRSRIRASTIGIASWTGESRR